MKLENYEVHLPSYSIGNAIYDKIGPVCESYGKTVLVIGGKLAPNGLLVCHCGSRIIRAAQECCSAWGKQVFRIGVVTMYREVLFPVVEERDQSAY